MTVAFARGGENVVIDEPAQREAVRAAIDLAGDCRRTLIIPPDGSRPHSGAGRLTAMIYADAAAESCHVMPALGTHKPMSPEELRSIFGDDIPLDCFREHRWRDDLVRLGTVPADFVHSVSEGVLGESMPDYGIPVEINAAVAEGGYSAIFSVGQVVPHEVIGMANGIKNILVGTGGQETINKSHFLGAAYGMERMMGRARTPVREVMDYAHERFLARLGIVYMMTVMERAPDGQLVMRGLFVGNGPEAFEAAAELSRRVNVNVLSEPQEHVVAYMEPREFQSTWLSNKAVYRTRMAIADGGLLTVLAPGVRMFGEDAQIDRLIRRYGYHGTPATLRAVADNADLRANLSAAAHLIHGSSESRFRIVYATDPELLSREEIEGVGFEWRDVRDAMEELGMTGLTAGPNAGFYYVPEPALGLWAAEERWTGSST